MPLVAVEERPEEEQLGWLVWHFVGWQPGVLVSEVKIEPLEEHLVLSFELGLAEVFLGQEPTEQVSAILQESVLAFELVLFGLVFLLDSQTASIRVQLQLGFGVCLLQAEEMQVLLGLLAEGELVFLLAALWPRVFGPMVLQWVFRPDYLNFLRHCQEWLLLPRLERLAELQLQGWRLAGLGL